MKKHVYIIVIGNIDIKLIKRIERRLNQTLGVSINVMKGVVNPSFAFDPVRKQYYSTKILKELIKNPPQDILKIIGIIDVDLYIPILTFIFGEAQLGGIGAIVSIARLRQEFYNIEPDEELLAERLEKEVFHELGHTFGLTHCRKNDCVMYLSNSIRDVDNKPGNFCPECNEILLAELAKEKNNI